MRRIFRFAPVMLMVIIAASCIQKPTVPEPERDEPEPPDETGPTAFQEDLLHPEDRAPKFGLTFLI